MAFLRSTKIGRAGESTHRNLQFYEYSIRFVQHRVSTRPRPKAEVEHGNLLLARADEVIE
jgi:hypothetical protein